MALDLKSIGQITEEESFDLVSVARVHEKLADIADEEDRQRLTGILDAILLIHVVKETSRCKESLSSEPIRSVLNLAYGVVRSTSTPPGHNGSAEFASSQEEYEILKRILPGAENGTMEFDCGVQDFKGRNANDLARRISCIYLFAIKTFQNGKTKVLKKEVFLILRGFGILTTNTRPAILMYGLIKKSEEEEVFQLTEEGVKAAKGFLLDMANSETQGIYVPPPVQEAPAKRSRNKEKNEFN